MYMWWVAEGRQGGKVGGGEVMTGSGNDRVPENSGLIA